MAVGTTVDVVDTLRNTYRYVVATTYGVDPLFIDRYVFEKLEAFADADDVAIIADARQLEGSYLSAAYVSPLVNRRYLVHGVASTGAFHPKLILAGSEKRLLLLVGSGNLTSGGMTRHLELADAWEHDCAKGEPPNVMKEAFRFLRELGVAYPSESVHAMLDGLERLAPDLAASATGGAGEQLLSTLKSPLLDQIAERVRAAQDDIVEVHVSSPYFDRDAALLDAMDERFAADSYTFYVRDGETALPKGAFEAWSQDKGIPVHGRRLSIDGPYRFLHAKVLHLRGKKNDWFAFGSANATTPALARTHLAGNVELLVLRRLDRGRRKNPTLKLLGSIARIEKCELSELVVRDEPESKPETTPFACRLLQARLKREDARVEFQVSAIPEEPCSARLRRIDDSHERLVEVELTQDGCRTMTLAIDVLFDGPVVIQLELASGSKSTPAFVEDQVVGSSGGSSKTRRLIRDAKRSSRSFELALEWLLMDGTGDDLVEFYWFVDIPFSPKTSLAGFRRRTGAIAGLLREREPRALRWQITLDEAVDRFMRRHVSRLNRHAKQCRAAGIDNFLQILVCLHAALDQQREALLHGLGASDVLSIDEWAGTRELMDRIFRRYGDLAEVVTSYVEGLCNKLGDPQAKALFDEGLDEMRSGYDSMLAWQRDLDDARAKLQVATTPGKTVDPLYFPGNVLLRWVAYRTELNRGIGRAIGRLSAA